MTHLRIVPVLGLLLASLVGPDTVSAGTAELKTTEGETLSGQLNSLSSDGIVLLDDDGTSKTVPLKSVLMLNLGTVTSQLPDSYIDVELLDGTRLHCKNYSLKGKSITVTLLRTNAVGPETLDIPLEEVLFIVRDPQITMSRPDWTQLMRDRGKADVLVVGRDDRLDGIKGTALGGTDTGDAVEFRIAGGRDARIQLSRLQGMIFSQASRAVVPQTLCKVIDANGNLYAAQSVTLSDGKISLKTVSGLELTFPEVDQIAKLDFSQGNLTYLSNLEPIDESIRSELGEFFAGGYRNDKDFSGGAIRLGGESFPKGLCVHAVTELTYNIQAQYKQLKMIIGVDDSVQTDSVAKLTITADGRELYTTEVTRGMKPVPIALNVEGVDTLRIKVDLGRPFDIGSEIALADAKLVK